MNKNQVRYMAIASGIILLVVVVFGLWPALTKSYEIASKASDVEEASFFQLAQEESLKELLTSSKELQIEASESPFKLLEDDERLDVIRIFESIANVSGNEIEIATSECDVEEDEKPGLCFSLTITGSFAGLLNSNENLSNIPFAHNIETINTRYRKKEGVYITVIFLRVYTTQDVG